MFASVYVYRKLVPFFQLFSVLFIHSFIKVIVLIVLFCVAMYCVYVLDMSLVNQIEH